MTLRQYLIVMLLGTVLSWAAVALILTMVNPESASPATYGIFYTSVFLAVTGTFSVLGFVSRVFILKKYAFVSLQVAISFRQALMLAALVTLSLYLQSHSLLKWWIILLVVLALTVIEGVFVTTKVRK